MARTTRKAKQAKVETPEVDAPEVDRQLDAETEVVEPGEAEATWVVNQTPAGEALAEIFGGDRIAFTILDYSDDTFTAQLELDGEVYISDADNGDRYPSAQAAAANALRKVPAVQERDVKVQEGRGDFEYERPASGDNAPEVEPWAEGEPDAERLRELGTDIAARVAAYKENMKAGRGEMLTASREIREARDTIASRSKTKKKGVNKDFWGDYAREFFPGFLEQFPGKNALSEAAELGGAPEMVIDLWPEGQTSPKSFQGWMNTARGYIREYGAKVILTDCRKAIDQWNEDGRPEGDEPACPGRDAIRDAMQNGDITERLDAERLERIQSTNRLSQNKPEGYEANVKRLRKEEADLRAAKAIAEWKFGELPEGDAIDTNPIFKAVQKQVELDYAAALQTKEEAEETIAKKATEKFAETIGFAAKEIDVAAQHLLNILISHSDAPEVLETLNAMFEQRQAQAEADADADEDAADAAADAGASEDAPEAAE